MKRIHCVLVALAMTTVVIVLDLVTKNIFFGKPDLIAGFSFFGGWLQLTDHKNFGITFDLPAPRALILTFSLAMLTLILFGIVRAIQQNNLRNTLALGLLFGGAVGNLIDRLTLGYVRDWILLFNRSAINLADLAIAIGLVWYFFKTSTNKKHPPVNSDPAGGESGT